MTWSRPFTSSSTRVDPLSGHSRPDAARLLVIGRRPKHGDAQPAWIGILNDEGLRDLRRSGHDTMAGACVPELPPERVRFVDISFRAAVESASDAELRALLASTLPDRPLVTESSSEGPDSVVIELRMPPDLRCMQGHFPELPVVPGAAQLGWALQFGAGSLGTAPSFRSLRNIKFQRIIQPGQSLRLSLKVNRQSAMLQFEYASATGKHSSGHIETCCGNG